MEELKQIAAAVDRLNETARMGVAVAVVATLLVVVVLAYAAHKVSTLAAETRKANGKVDQWTEALGRDALRVIRERVKKA